MSASNRAAARPSRHLVAIAFALACLVPALALAQSPERPRRSVVFSAGLGLPDLLHAEVGLFVHPRAVLEVSSAIVVFNVLTGIGAEMHFLGEGAQPRHALTLGAHMLVNPLLAPGDWFTAGGGETIGIGADMLVGYRFLSDAGFFFRARGGVLVYRAGDATEAGPMLLSISAGWAL